MSLKEIKPTACGDLKLPRAVTVVEVGLRDGLQNEPRILPTEQKVALLQALVGAGLGRIELTSFVHPKLVPQLADAEALAVIAMAPAPAEPAVRYAALVPNEKGYQRAVAAGIREVCFVFSVSESHNQSNVRCSVEESLRKLAAVFLQAAGEGVKIRVALATAFGCPFEGEVPQSRVRHLLREVLDMSPSEVVLSDTIGVANPQQVYNLFSLVRDRYPSAPLAAHFHDTQGMGLANVVAAMQTGVSVFDAAIGGLGGCPFAPGATGNIATEDLVNMLDRMGVCTGINLDALLAAASLVGKYAGRQINSHVRAALGMACTANRV